MASITAAMTAESGAPKLWVPRPRPYENSGSASATPRTRGTVVQPETEYEVPSAAAEARNRISILCPRAARNDSQPSRDHGPAAAGYPRLLRRGRGRVNRLMAPHGRVNPKFTHFIEFASVETARMKSLAFIRARVFRGPIPICTAVLAQFLPNSFAIDEPAFLPLSTFLEPPR